MSNEVHVLIYREDGDACCGTSVEVYGDLGAARRRMKEAYRKMIVLLYHDCGVIRDDYYCEIFDDNAVIVEGLDSYSWTIASRQIL